MKKWICLAFLITIIFAGCQKQEFEQVISLEDFYAYVEDFDIGTKTAMNSDRQVVWSKGDCLAIFHGNSLSSKYQVTDESADKSTAVFELIDNPGDDVHGEEIPCNVAFYPYSEGLSLSSIIQEDQGLAYNITGAEVPQIQVYKEDSFSNGALLMSAVTELHNDHDLNFKNVLGAMKLQLKGSQAVTSITVEGNKGEKLSGTAIVTAYANNVVPAIKMTEDASTKVTLNCGDGVQLNETETTDFIIVIPPVHLSDGFTVTLIDTNENVHILVADAANTVYRSSILVMPEVNLNFKNEDKPEDDVNLRPLDGSITISDDMVFEDTPEFLLSIDNPNTVAVRAEVEMTFYTDKGNLLKTKSYSLNKVASGLSEIKLTFGHDLNPGFYDAHCSLNGNPVAKVSFGFRPFEIVSAPDMQPDFDEFWETAKAQLPELIEGKTVHLQEVKSTDTHKIYRVEMQSVPNGLDGAPVIVRGFFVEPQDKKKHPVLIHFFGWDYLMGDAYVPSGGYGNYTEFYVYTRGQYNNNRPATHEKSDAWIAEHGEWSAADPCEYASIINPNDKYNWFGYNFGDKNGYYYRGAFMDCVQAVRFMASRPTSDMNNLFAEGSSQGGALTYACAARSDYPFTAIASNVAFLGDFPDYFDIVSWPGNVAKLYKGTMTDEEMYAFLSYFDTKNLATRISCAVQAGTGLYDTMCPPHTTFAPFNNLNTEDKIMIVENMEHSYPVGWESKWYEFFEKRMNR